jgi:hypothetical protein
MLIVWVLRGCVGEHGDAAQFVVLITSALQQMIEIMRSIAP